MDIDRLNVNRISSQEMRHRIANNLYKRCGGPGHYAAQCTTDQRSTRGDGGRGGRGGTRRGTSQHGGRGQQQPPQQWNTPQQQRYNTPFQQPGQPRGGAAWVRQMETPWPPASGIQQSFTSSPHPQFYPSVSYIHYPTQPQQPQQAPPPRNIPSPSTGWVEEIYDGDDQYLPSPTEQGNGQPLR